MSRHYCVYCSRKRDEKFLSKIFIKAIDGTFWLCKEHFRDSDLFKTSTPVDYPGLTNSFGVVFEFLQIDYFNE